MRRKEDWWRRQVWQIQFDEEGRRAGAEEEKREAIVGEQVVFLLA